MGAPASLRPAVCFDRDGTLMEDVDYCARPGQVRVFAEAPAALGRLKAAGFFLVLATNQSGIGRGFFSEEDYRGVHAEFIRQLGPGLLDACYHCPEAPEGASARRKPGPGMLLEAAREHSLALAHSYMVGDSWADVACGQRAGVAGAVLVLTGRKRTPAEQASAHPAEADYVAAGVAEAADWILLHHG